MNLSARCDQRLEEEIKARLASMPATAGDCVHLWQLDCCSVPRSDDSCLAALSPSERDRTSGFTLDDDRRVFAIGRATLRALLGAYLERSPRDVVIGYGEFGRPHIAPSHNAGRIEFNIAHSGGRILFAVTQGRAVGIDVERVRPVARLSVVARTILTREEWRTWSGMDEHRRVDAFFLAWVRKEAVLKARGCGLAVRPSRIAVTLARGEPLTPIPLVDCVEQRSWWLGDVHQPGGWAAALALEGAADAAVIYSRLNGSSLADSPDQISRPVSGSAAS